MDLRQPVCIGTSQAAPYPRIPELHGDLHSFSGDFAAFLTHLCAHLSLLFGLFLPCGFQFYGTLHMALP